MFFDLLIVLYIVICVALITIVLLQSSKGEGLAGVFGSGGGSQTIFGARTGDILTKSTTVLAVLFMLLSLILAVMSGQKARSLSQEISRAADRLPPPGAAGGGEMEPPPVTAAEAENQQLPADSRNETAPLE